jgi:hypothetical protein
MFPAPSLLVPTAHLTDLGPGERVRERGPDLEALFPAFAFLNEDFILLRYGTPNVTDFVANVLKLRARCRRVCFCAGHAAIGAGRARRRAGAFRLTITVGPTGSAGLVEPKARESELKEHTFGLKARPFEPKARAFGLRARALESNPRSFARKVERRWQEWKTDGYYFFPSTLSGPS